MNHRIRRALALLLAIVMLSGLAGFAEADEANDVPDIAAQTSGAVPEDGEAPAKDDAEPAPQEDAAGESGAPEPSDAQQMPAENDGADDPCAQPDGTSDGSTNIDRQETPDDSCAQPDASFGTEEEADAPADSDESGVPETPEAGEAGADKEDAAQQDAPLQANEGETGAEPETDPQAISGELSCEDEGCVTGVIQASNPSASAASFSIDVGYVLVLGISGCDADDFTWTSSKPSVASVLSPGYILGVAAGKATITARSGSVKVSCTVTVTDPTKAVSVTLSQTGTVDLSMDDETGLTVRPFVSPETAQQTTVYTWTTSNKKVAGVTRNADGSCLIAGLREGTATITCTTDTKKSASFKVKVYDPRKATSVALNYAGTVDLAIPIDETASSLTAVADVLPATAKDYTTYTWKTSNAKVAGVSRNADGSCLITGLREGTATITCTTDTKKSASFKVKVYDPRKATSVALSCTGLVELDIDGGTLTAVADVLPATAKAYTTYTWKTSNAKVVSIVRNADGSCTVCATGLQEGTATITCTTNTKKSASFKVKVIDPFKPSAVTLSRTGTVVLDLNECAFLTAALAPSGARTAFTWKTSNAQVVPVAESGESATIQGLKTGTATVTVTTRNGKKASVKVTVVDSAAMNRTSYQNLLKLLGRVDDPLSCLAVENTIRSRFAAWNVRSAYIDEAMARLKAAPALYRNIYVYSFYEYTISGNQAGTGAWYDAADDTARITQGIANNQYLSTLYHECGHAIDFNALKGTWKAVTKEDDAVYACILEDTQTFVRAKLDALTGYTDLQKEHIYQAIMDPEIISGDTPWSLTTKEREGYWKIRSQCNTELSYVPASNACMVSDVIGGVTNNVLNGGWGHWTAEYWYTDDGETTRYQSLEAWAEFFSAMVTGDTASQKANEKYFAKTVDYFKNTVAVKIEAFFKNKLVR